MPCSRSHLSRGIEGGELVIHSPELQSLPVARLEPVTFGLQARTATHTFQFILTTQVQNSCIFGALNNAANTSNLTSANVSKSHCVINLNTYIFHLKEKHLQMQIQECQVQK